MLAGLLVPAVEPTRERVEVAATRFAVFRQSPLPGLQRETRDYLSRTISVNERLQESLHQVTGFVVVPVFAFANAGLDCAKATGSAREVRRHFGDRLRYVARHLPLEVHPHAHLAAVAAEAAGRQGRFWEIRGPGRVRRRTRPGRRAVPPRPAGHRAGRPRTGGPGLRGGERCTQHPDVLHRRPPPRGPLRRPHPDRRTGDRIRR